MSGTASSSTAAVATPVFNTGRTFPSLANFDFATGGTAASGCVWPKFADADMALSLGCRSCLAPPGQTPRCAWIQPPFQPGPDSRISNWRGAVSGYPSVVVLHPSKQTHGVVACIIKAAASSISRRNRRSRMARCRSQCRLQPMARQPAGWVSNSLRCNASGWLRLRSGQHSGQRERQRTKRKSRSSNDD